MALRATICAAAAMFAAAPAQAGWDVMVSDRGDIRSAVLIGFSESDPKQQIAVICTTLDGEQIGDPVVTLAMPSTGKFTVRPGDAAAMTVRVGDQVWELDSAVDQNGTNGFATSVHSPDGIELAAAAAEFDITVTAGDIDLEMLIGPEGAAEASRQFLEACGSR